MRDDLWLRGAAGAAALIGAATTPAFALDELSLGLMAHNIQVTDGKNAGKEDGPNLQIEAKLAPIEALALVGKPRPYLVASVNVAGDTSFAGGGLSWRWRFAPEWALEPALGYVVHDGETNNPFASGDPRAEDFSRDRVLLGSRDLFRTSIALTRDLPGPWAAQVIYEHLSHGQILGEGRNQGLDEAGVRLSYRFAER